MMSATSLVRAKEIVLLFICCERADWVIPRASATRLIEKPLSLILVFKSI